MLHKKIYRLSIDLVNFSLRRRFSKILPQFLGFLRYLEVYYKLNYGQEFMIIDKTEFVYENKSLLKQFQLNKIKLNLKMG